MKARTLQKGPLCIQSTEYRLVLEMYVCTPLSTGSVYRDIGGHLIQSTDS